MAPSITDTYGPNTAAVAAFIARCKTLTRDQAQGRRLGRRQGRRGARGQGFDHPGAVRALVGPFAETSMAEWVA